MINIFGGKITTYRRLSEAILKHIESFLGQRGNPWTDMSSLPGGDIAIDGKFDLNNKIQEKYSFLNEEIVKRLVRSYGTVSFDILGNAKNIESLGENFGSGLYEKEVIYLIQNEWARSSEDILFRRSKLGLSLTKNEKNKLDKFLENYYKLNNVSESPIKPDNIVETI
tara:strand:- start:23 stop:526 length:504 start_codon:yes stop_codon:yes gene_type:complete